MSQDTEDEWQEIEIEYGDLLMMIASLSGAMTQLQAAVGQLNNGQSETVNEALHRSITYNDGVMGILKLVAARTAATTPKPQDGVDR